MIEGRAKAIVDQRILITGGLGFVGSGLAHRLAAQNQVCVVDCLSPDAGGNVHNLDGLERPVESLPLDLARSDAYEDPRLKAAIANAGFIFHCAARTSHPGSMHDPLGNLGANAEATLRLLEALRRRAGDVRFVLPGTTSQTGRMVREPIDEDHPERPRDIYSAHKGLQERYAMIYGETHGLRAVSLRLSNLYGPRAAIHSPALGFVNYFIGRALQGEDIPVYGEGLQRRSLLHVDDALDALLAAAPAAGPQGEVLQAAHPNVHTVSEIAQTIAAEIGGRVRHVPYPAARASTDVGDAAFSNARIWERLGWEPQVSLAQGLRATAAYYRPRLGNYLVMA